MDLFLIFFTIFGLILFEVISSIDNAVINAEVLGTMSEKARRWFLIYGIIFAVFVVRGVLPLLIVWATLPDIGFLDAITVTFSSDPQVIAAVKTATPPLLLGGGIFLVFLFFYWLFVEEKNYGLKVEKFIHSQSVWFFAVVSLLLMGIVWYALKQDAALAFAAVVGSTAFFITHGFKENAEKKEKELLGSHVSDISKILYLEVLDMIFSIDGVLGAFAFTLVVPFILIGNGIGAFVVRELTIRGVKKIKHYLYLKNGAMYSVFFLGTIMVLEGFGHHIPSWISPLITCAVIAFFYLKSVKALRI